MQDVSDCWGDVVVFPYSSSQSCSSIHANLQSVDGFLRDSIEDSIAVVDSASNEDSPKAALRPPTKPIKPRPTDA